MVYYNQHYAYMYIYIYIYTYRERDMYAYTYLYTYTCMCIYIHIHTCMCVYMYMYIYIYTHIHIHIPIHIHIYIYTHTGPPGRHVPGEPEGGHPDLPGKRGREGHHRWNRNPRPQPKTFSRLVFLIYFSQSCIFRKWLSGALVGVGGPHFIG